MRICNACGYPLEDDELFCTECGTKYEEKSFRWTSVENAAYRERYGVLPQLNFVNQNGFDLIQAPPVQYSKIAHSNAATAARRGAGIAKGFFKGMGKGVLGSIKLVTGNVGQGAADLIGGTSQMFTSPFNSSKENREIDEEIQMFESRFWKERHFTMTFNAVPICSGEDYTVQVDKDFFNGFYVNSNGVYFEGLIGNDGNPVKGISIYPDGSRFLGTFNGADAYEGLYLYGDGSYYRGFFQNGMRHGEGGVYISDEVYYFGEWANNSANGFGTSKNCSGEVYTGNWIDGKPSE